MDSSREHDLYALKRRMEDDSLSDFQRRVAAKSFHLIKRQLADRRLQHLREGLIRATRANDADWIEKYQLQIKQHSYRMGYERPEKLWAEV